MAGVDEDGDGLASFLADRPANAIARAEQEAAWGSTEVDARQLLFEREAAARHASLLGLSIAAFWRVATFAESWSTSSSSSSRGARWLSKLTPEMLSLVADFAVGRGGEAIVKATATLREQVTAVDGVWRGVRVYARVRPTLKEQSVLAVERWPGESRVVMHDGRLTRSGRFLRTTHHVFAVDGVFQNGGLCERVVSPLLKRFKRGKNATLLLFGQTGTGKTHTLREALNYIAAKEELFKKRIELSFVELRGGGKSCLDLLGSSKVKLLSDEKDEARFVGATRVVVASGADLLVQAKMALDRRQSEATERNAASSRSHAVCELRCDECTLRLVDLAGSERKWETMAMRSRDQHLESANINLSLMALKDCFRAQHQLATTGTKKRIPIRASALTRVLRSCFETQDPEGTAILATLSPAPEDIIHSVHTLRHVTLMAPALASRNLEVATERLVPTTASSRGSRVSVVEEWSAGELREWLMTFDSGRFAHIVLPAGVKASDLLSLSARRLGDLFAGQSREARQAAEGAMWVVAADADDINNNNTVGYALYSALRREAMRLRDLPSGR